MLDRMIILRIIDKAPVRFPEKLLKLRFLFAAERMDPIKEKAAGIVYASGGSCSVFRREYPIGQINIGTGSVVILSVIMQSCHRDRKVDRPLAELSPPSSMGTDGANAPWEAGFIDNPQSEKLPGRHLFLQFRDIGHDASVVSNADDHGAVRVVIAVEHIDFHQIRESAQVPLCG